MKPATLLFFAANSLGLASAASIGSPNDGVLGAVEKRGCFSTGANFGDDRDRALSAARTACQGPLKGNYSKREARVRCYTISSAGSGKHVKLTVGLTGPNAPSSRVIGFDECYDGLSKEINNCGKGGDTTYGNWNYR
jgi:hypothetical protein